MRSDTQRRTPTPSCGHALQLRSPHRDRNTGRPGPGSHPERHGHEPNIIYMIYCGIGERRLVPERHLRACSREQCPREEDAFREPTY